MRSIVNRLMSLHDRWVCFGPWFHVGYIHVLETKANFRDHVFFLSEPNTVAKALLQDFRDFRRPEPKELQCCSRSFDGTQLLKAVGQWGQIPRFFASVFRISCEAILVTMISFSVIVSLCHCAVVERVNPKVL